MRAHARRASVATLVLVLVAALAASPPASATPVECGERGRSATVHTESPDLGHPGMLKIDIHVCQYRANVRGDSSPDEVYWFVTLRAISSSQGTHTIPSTAFINDVKADAQVMSVDAVGAGQIAKTTPEPGEQVCSNREGTSAFSVSYKGFTVSFSWGARSKCVTGVAETLATAKWRGHQSTSTQGFTAYYGYVVQTEPMADDDDAGLQTSGLLHGNFRHDNGNADWIEPVDLPWGIVCTYGVDCRIDPVPPMVIP